MRESNNVSIFAQEAVGHPSRRVQLEVGHINLSSGETSRKEIEILLLLRRR